MSYESNQHLGLLRLGSTIQGLRRKACILGTCLSLLIVMVGCHSGPAATTNIPAPVVSIALGTAPSSLTVGQTYQFSATITNSTNTAVTWSAGGVTGGNATVGTISSTGLYTAPAMMPSPASVAIMATSQADTTKSASTSVNINISLALNLNSASVQVTGTQQFTATIEGSTNTDVIWTVNGVAGGNSTLGTISNAGLYTAPAYPPSPNTVTVTATSVAEGSMAASSTVTVAAPPISVSVNPTALDLQVGHTVQFSDVVTTSSTIPISTTVTWGASAPEDVGNGVVGTISATGNYTAPTRIPMLNPVKVYVVSKEDPSKSAIAYVTVTKAPVLLTISTNSLANGVVNSPYSATVSAYGGAQPYAWSITGGSLPTGLTLNPSSGVISGTPTTAGTTNFTISVTDQSATPQTQTANLSITIIPQLAVTTTSLSNGAVGSGYTSALNATGGVTPYTWSIITGSLPAGLSLNPSTGAITGNPATGSAGAYPITVKVTDAGTPQQSQTFSTTITIYTGLTIITTSLPNGTVNSSYSTTLTSVGGTGAITWSVSNGSLPANLTLTPSTGVISGIPAAAATTSFTVTATDSGNPQQIKNQLLSLTVNPVLTISTTTLLDGTVGASYNQSIQSNGGTLPIKWSVTNGSLPTGLQLRGTPSGAGSITGTPTASGPYSFTVTATDSSTPAVNVNQALTITIDNAPLAVNTTSLPGAVINVPYSQALQASGGTPPYAWTVASGSTLPPGLSISGSGVNWTITGTPTAAGSTNFSLKVTDSSTPTAQSVTQSLSMTVSLSACGTGNESILSGQYAFNMGGYNSTGYLAEVGSFTADGTGHITAGEVDSTGTLIQSGASIDTTRSSYSVGSDNRGCATIATSNGAITTRFVLGALSSGKAMQGRMIEWEAPTSSAYIASGRILKQTTPFSLPSGNYVFHQDGAGGAGERIAAAGVISFGSSGAITTGEMDMNDGGNLTNTTGVTGTSTAADTNGRTTMTSTWQGDPTARQSVMYLVSGSQSFYMPVGGGSAFIGEADLQTGTFSNSSLSGKMVIYGNRTSSASAGDSYIGLVNSTGSGSFTISFYEVDGAGNSNTPPAWQNLQSAKQFTCSYSVAANGRMLPGGTDPNCTGAPIFYLSAANTAVLLGSGSGVDVGAVEPQANITFDNSALSGNFFMGLQGVITQAQETEIDQVTLSNGTVNSTSDFTSTTYQEGDNTNQDTITVNSDGTVSSVKNGVTIVGVVIINSNKFVMISNVKDAYPYIMIGER